MALTDAQKYLLDKASETLARIDVSLIEWQQILEGQCIVEKPVKEMETDNIRTVYL